MESAARRMTAREETDGERREGERANEGTTKYQTEDMICLPARRLSCTMKPIGGVQGLTSVK